VQTIETITRSSAGSDLAWYKILFISTFWFGVSVHWTALLLILMPSNIADLVGQANKGKSLAYTLLGGSVVALFATPVYGYWSDNCQRYYSSSSASKFLNRLGFFLSCFSHRLGKRKPFIIVGCIGNCVALACMSIAPNLLLYIASFIALQLFHNCAAGPYSAIVPDLVPISKRGLAAGFIGLMTMLGNLCGGMLGLAVGYVDNWILYGIVILILFGSMVASIVFMREEAGYQEDATKITTNEEEQRLVVSSTEQPSQQQPQKNVDSSNVDIDSEKYSSEGNNSKVKRILLLPFKLVYTFLEPLFTSRNFRLVFMYVKA